MALRVVQKLRLYDLQLQQTNLIYQAVRSSGLVGRGLVTFNGCMCASFFGGAIASSNDDALPKPIDVAQLGTRIEHACGNGLVAWMDFMPLTWLLTTVAMFPRSSALCGALYVANYKLKFAKTPRPYQH